MYRTFRSSRMERETKIINSIGSHEDKKPTILLLGLQSSQKITFSGLKKTSLNVSTAIILFVGSEMEGITSSYTCREVESFTSQFLVHFKTAEKVAFRREQRTFITLKYVSDFLKQWNGTRNQMNQFDWIARRQETYSFASRIAN